MKKIYLVLICCYFSQLVFAQLPANMYSDAAYSPFLYGVASFEPTESQVIIWTHITPDSATQAPISVDWQMARDSNFVNIVQSGTDTASVNKDWTVAVDVASLDSYTTYYYRFQAPNGNYTRKGRTRTAPAATSTTVNHIRMSVISCSSVYSGFFNSYQQVAQRLDLDAVIHLGDYIYDFVDADEEVRVPTPYPVSPTTKEDWRERQRYYLLDPDLRAARQVHPWIVIWDNHDTEYGGTATQAAESREAFLEYVPMRLQTPTDTKKIYRKFSYGSLLDIFMTDILLYRDVDNLPSGDPSILGANQYTWLTTELQNSTAKWKLVGNQKMMCGWSVANLPVFFPTIGNGSVLDPNSWDGYDAARDRLLDFIENNNIDNVMVLSGDAHVSMASDLHQDPGGSSYNSGTGAGSVAVEFLPTSITRGNFDEMGYPGWVVSGVETYMASANPNQVFSNIVDHGYGILDMKPDSAIAEFWYMDILSQTTTQTFERGLLLKDTENHWHRTNMSSPTPPKDYSLTINTQKIEALASSVQMKVFPNPSEGKYTLNFELKKSEELTISVLDIATGQVLHSISNELYLANDAQQITFDISKLPAGSYFLRLKGEELDTGKVIIKK